MEYDFLEDIFLKCDDRHSSVNAYLGYSAISIIKKNLLLYKIEVILNPL